MPQIQPFAPGIIMTPAGTAFALELVTSIDLLRLKAIARLHARGLPPDVGWDDLLQEAFARVLTGARQPPQGVSMVAFLAGVMRSLRADHWRRALQSGHAVANDTHQAELADPAPDPERALSALQELATIDQLFAADRLALEIIGGLARGLSAEQIRSANGISKTDYDSARRRMRRLLLRQGLTSCEPY
jgi:DNA-directed RNA polymerase specialized sigma24 family protein